MIKWINGVKNLKQYLDHSKIQNMFIVIIILTTLYRKLIANLEDLDFYI